MKINLYLILIFVLFSCSKENNKNIEINTQKKISRSIDFITNSISKSIKNNPKVKLDTFKRSNIEYRQYKIENGINEWTLNNEFYENGNLKEKGIYLNGWSFGKWYKYEKNGTKISEIDFSNGEVILNQKLNFEKIFLNIKTKSDSLLIERFGKSFFKEKIKFNIEKSYWYSLSNSGNFLEYRKNKPNKYLLRYSIIENDTIIFTPIELVFDKKTNYSAQTKKGIPNERYDFKINYEKAKIIAIKNDFGTKKHNNEFQKRENLNLYYNENKQSYFWTISDIPNTTYSETKNGKIRKGIGKSLKINCSNGEFKIEKYKGSVIYD